MLGTLAAPDHMDTPLTARRVVLVYGRVCLLFETHVLKKVPQVDDLDCHLRYSAAAVDNDTVFCIFERHLKTPWLNLAKRPVVDLRETLLLRLMPSTSTRSACLTS